MIRTARRGRPAWLATLLLLGALIAGTAPALAREKAQERTGSVLVQVSDEDGTGVGGLDVILVVSNGEAVIAELPATTGEDGSALFTEVAAGAANTARPVTTYDGHPYQGDAVAVRGGEQVVVPVRIFRTVDENGRLHINILHVILNALEPGVYQGIQVMSVLNVGERPALSGPEVDGERAGLVIPVPSGAREVGPLPPGMSGLDETRLRIEPDRLLDMRPVPPGSHDIAVQYILVTGENGADVEITVPYPTAQVSLLIGPDPEAVEVASSQLTELPPQQIPGQGTYANWNSDVLSAGDTLRFHLGPRRPAISVTAWALLGLAVALFASAAASLWGARRHARGAGPAPATPAGRGAILVEIAALDDEHEAGRVDDADYHARRAAALERLAAAGTADRSAAGPADRGAAGAADRGAAGPADRGAAEAGGD